MGHRCVGPGRGPDPDFRHRQGRAVEITAVRHGQVGAHRVAELVAVVGPRHGPPRTAQRAAHKELNGTAAGAAAVRTVSVGLAR